MKLKSLTYVLALPVLALFTAGGLNDDGRAGRTGSPGETTCVSCHDNFALNSGGGSITLSSTNLTGWEYIPGTNYHMVCTVARNGNSLFGMGLEALTTANQNAGNLVITNPASTQIKTATVGGVSRRNVVHTLNGGVGNGSKAFAFDWNAPATNIGNVTFYYAGVAANGDGNDDVGDHVYSGSQVVTPAAANSVEEFAGPGQLSVFPDPATDHFNIAYTLTTGRNIQVTLHDMQGRMVRELIAAPRSAGRHVEMISGLSDLGTGTYILRTALGADVRTQRIMLGVLR
jgi:hypothetical protein